MTEKPLSINPKRDPNPHSTHKRSRNPNPHPHPPSRQTTQINCCIACLRVFFRRNRLPEVSSAQVFLGLPNYYSNCYLNSALQSLFSIPEFLTILHQSDGPLSKQILEIDTNRDESSESEVRKLISVVGRRVIPEFGRMQCAHVCFINLINALSEEGSEVRSRFLVEVKYQIECKKEHIVSNTVNRYISLSLPLPPNGENVKIEDCLALFLASKPIRFPCDQCGHSHSTHTAFIANLSQLLVIHFQRYIDGLKDTRCVSFASIIEFAGCQFEVVAVVYHFGSLLQGHYFAVVCRKGRWYEANDARVKEVGREGLRCEDAYLLFCRKVTA